MTESWTCGLCRAETDDPMKHFAKNHQNEDEFKLRGMSSGSRGPFELTIKIIRQKSRVWTELEVESLVDAPKDESEAMAPRARSSYPRPQVLDASG